MNSPFYDTTAQDIDYTDHYSWDSHTIYNPAPAPYDLREDMGFLGANRRNPYTRAANNQREASEDLSGEPEYLGYQVYVKEYDVDPDGWGNL